MGAIGVSCKQGLRKENNSLHNLLLVNLRLTRPETYFNQCDNRGHEEIFLGSLDYQEKAGFEACQGHLHQGDQGLGKPWKGSCQRGGRACCTLAPDKKAKEKSVTVVALSLVQKLTDCAVSLHGPISYVTERKLRGNFA